MLTNDGDLARKMELPSSGIVRTYSVRVYGNVSLTGVLSERTGEGDRMTVVCGNYSVKGCGYDVPGCTDASDTELVLEYGRVSEKGIVGPGNNHTIPC